MLLHVSKLTKLMKVVYFFFLSPKCVLKVRLVCVFLVSKRFQMVTVSLYEAVGAHSCVLFRVRSVGSCHVGLVNDSFG